VVTGDLLDALCGIKGATITVRHPLPEASLRLMACLGVAVEIDATAEPCSRFLQPSHGRPWRVAADMCPECAEVAE
jgi:hypothetical protein